MTREPQRDRRNRRQRPVLSLFVALSLVGVGCGSGSNRTADTTDPAGTTESNSDTDELIGTRSQSSESAGATTTTTVEDVSNVSVSDTVPTADRPGATPDAMLPVSIVEIDFESGTVTIANHGTADVNLGDVVIWESPDHHQIDAQLLAGGASVTIDNPFRSSSSDGELALTRDNDFDNPDSMLSYVEWGSNRHAGSSIAVDAALWSTDAVTAGLKLGTDGEFASSAAQWAVLTPLPGATTEPSSPPGSTTAPPPDDYAPTPPESTPTAPSAPTAPPDDYAPSAPPAPPASSPPAPPPPDEY